MRLRSPLSVAATLLTALLVFGTGCIHGVRRGFPVVQPVADPSRDEIARYRAYDHFIRARDYERRGLPQMAALQYELAHQLDPSSEIVRLGLAEKYVALGKYTQALLTVRAGRDNEQLSEREKSVLATIYMKLRQFPRAAEVLESLEHKNRPQLYSLALLYESLHEPDKAIETYFSLLREEPVTQRMGLKLATLLLRQERYDEADTLLVQLQQRFGPLAQVHYLRGTVNLFRSDTAAALHHFQQALTIDSTHEDALGNVAQIAIQHEDYQAAIDAYQRLYATEPYGEVYGKTLALLYYYNDESHKTLEIVHTLLESNMGDYELHFYLALAALDLDSVQLARLELEKTLALESSFEDAWRQLCLLSMRLGDWDQALVDAERYVDALENKEGAWRTLGAVHTGRKEWGKAVKAYHQALAFDSSSARLWFELGSTLERATRIDEAAEAFRKVLALEPRNHVTANYLGYMWAEKGLHLDSARELIALALEEEPDNGAYLDSYAWVFYQLGHYDKAYTYILRALEKIDDDPVVFDHLGDIQWKRDEYAEAADAYERSLALEPDDPDQIRAKLQQAREKLKHTAK